MPQSHLRLVHADEMPPTLLEVGNDSTDLDAEYRQALLMLDIADYERTYGSNAYTRYVKKHGRRPPPTEAKAIGLVVGKRVKANDGRFYPKKTKAERAFERQYDEERSIAAERLDQSLRLRRAIAEIADLSVSPGKIDIFYLDEREIATKLQAAVNWLNRFAILRQLNGQDACSEDAQPGCQTGGGAA